MENFLNDETLGSNHAHDEQEIAETVQANVEMERHFYENDGEDLDNYLLADTVRNGS